MSRPVRIDKAGFAFSSGNLYLLPFLRFLLGLSGQAFIFNNLPKPEFVPTPPDSGCFGPSLSRLWPEFVPT